MPKLRMSWPNRITVGRILMIVPFVIAILHMNDQQYQPWARYAALLIFLAMAISDALDGWLARRNHTESRLGRFLDPLADKLLITCSCLLLASSGTAVPGMRLPDVVVVVIIGKDLYTVLGFLIIYLVTGELRIAPAKTGKLSTLLQLAMVVGILISPDITSFLPAFTYLVQGLWWSAAGVAIFMVVIYTRAGTSYLNEFEQREKDDT